MSENTTRQEKTICIRLKAYDHNLVDATAQKIVDALVAAGAKSSISGPIPLPTEKEIVTILRSPFKHKDSREQFELRTHKRLIHIKKGTKDVVASLTKVEIPAGVDISLDQKSLKAKSRKA